MPRNYDDWLTDVGPWPNASDEPYDYCDECGREGRRVSSFARPGLCWTCNAKDRERD